MAQIHIRNTCSFLARNSIGVIEHKSTHTMTYPFALAFQSPRNESCFRFHIDQNNSEDFKYPPTSQLWLNLLLCGALSLLWIPTGFILVVSKPNSKLSEVCGWYYRIDSSYNSLFCDKNNYSEIPRWWIWDQHTVIGYRWTGRKRIGSTLSG